MSVEVNDGGLSWKARIDTSQLPADAKKVESVLSDLNQKQKDNEKRILQSISSAYQSVYRDGIEAFKNMSPEVQKQVRVLTSFEKELKDVAGAQKELDSSLKAGTISQSEYSKVTGGLKIRAMEAKSAIALYSTALKNNLAILSQNDGSIAGYQKKLSVLKSELNNLSEAQLQSGKRGEELAREIQKTENQIESARNKVLEFARSFNESNTAISTYKRQLSELSKEYDKLSQSDRTGPKGQANLASVANINKQIQESERLRKTTLENLTVFKDTSGILDNLSQRVSILTGRYQQLTVAQAKDPNVGGKLQKEIKLYQDQINSVDKYNKALRDNATILGMANGSIDQKRAKLQALNAQWTALSASERANSDVSRKLQRDIKALTRELDSLDRSQRSTRTSGRLMNQVLLATTGFFTITQGTRLIKDIINVRGEIEQLEVAFTTMLQSKSRADALMKEIVDVATTTPFKLTEVADATKQLLAYGFAQREIKGELLAIGNVASGVGATFQEVAYAYGTLKTQGRAFARDIRQFTTRGIPIVSELANQFGVTESKINDMVSAGKIGFPEVQKAFQSLTSEGGQFFNLMEKQSQTVTGEIAKLQDRIQLMFNSIGEGNDGLIKSSIAGLSFLVENYNEVGNILGVLVLTYGSYRAALIATAASNAALGTSTIGLARIMVAFRTTLQTLNATFVVSPVGAYTAAITALGLAFYSLSQTINTAKSIQKNYNQVVEEGEIAAVKEKRRLEDLVSLLRKHDISLDQSSKAIDSLRSAMGAFLKDYTDDQIQILINTGRIGKLIEKQIDSVREYQSVQAAIAKRGDLVNELDEVEAKGIKAIGTFSQLGESLKNVFDPRRGANMSFGEWFGILTSSDKNEKLIVDQKTKDLKKQIEELDKFIGDSSKEIASGSGKVQREFDKLIGRTVENFDRLSSLIEDKGDAETIKKNLQDYMDALAPSDPQIATIKKQILKINDVLSNYDLKTENKSIKDAAKEREKVLNDLNKLEAKAYKKSFERREQEIEDTKRQFEELRNAAKSAGLGSGVLERIDNLELKATGDIRYRNETDSLKEELEKRKVIYQDYESYVKEFGLQEANERYQGELDIAKNYLDIIQDEYEKILFIPVRDRTGAQNERFKFLSDQIEAEKKIQQNQYKELLKSTQSYEDQREMITERYLLNKEQLIKNGDTKNLAQLEENYKNEISSLDDANAQKLGIYRRFFNGIETMSIKSARQLIGDIRKQLEALKDAGRISEQLYRETLARIQQAERSVESRLPKAMQDVAGSLNDIVSSLRDANSGFAQLVSAASNMLQRTAQIKSNINDFNQASMANNGKGDALGMAVSGAGVAGAIIGGIGMLNQTMDKFAQKQLDAIKIQIEFQRRILFGELELNRLYRERQFIAAEIDGSTLKTLEAQKKVLTDQIKEIADNTLIEDLFGGVTKFQADDLNRYYGAYEKEREKKLAKLAQGLYIDDTKVVKGGLFGLGKETVKVYKTLAGLSFDEIAELSTLGKLTPEAENAFQELKRLKEEGEEVEKQLKEVKEALNEIYTGGLTASGLGDTIIEGLKQGKRAVEDFGDDIESIIANALISGFKYSVLEEPLNELIKTFGADIQNKDLSPEQAIQNFKNSFGSILDSAGPLWEMIDDMMKEMGMSLSGDSSGRGLPGAIRREMTEQTASELSGLYRAMFELYKINNNTLFQVLAVSKEGLDNLIQIEVNTRNTVGRLDSVIVELKTIVKNTNQNGTGYDRGDGG